MYACVCVCERERQRRSDRYAVCVFVCISVYSMPVRERVGDGSNIAVAILLKNPSRDESAERVRFI